MMELVYTSSSKGVDRGSQGYCTVACSDSIPPLLKMNLENISDYSWVFPPHHKDFNKNPVSYSFVKIKSGDEWLRVISRIGLNGLDYSGRPNKIAHYICLEEDDLDECHVFSPAHIISNSSTFIESWEEGSDFLEKSLCDLSSDSSASSTSYWEEVTGDAGWASHLVQQYQDSPNSQINVIYDLHVDPLKLIAEATSQLSSKEQWETTFSTYFNGDSLYSTCNWKFILRGSKYHEGLKSLKNVIDLQDFQGRAPVNDLGEDDLSIETPDSVTSIPQKQFKASSGEPVSKQESQNNKPGGQKIGVFVLVAVIIALAGVLVFNPADKKSADGSNDVQEEVFYNYKVDLQSIPAGHELEEHGDVLVIVNTEEFLNKLRDNKKMSLDVFKTKQEKLETKMVSTNEFKVVNNVISKMFLKKIDGEFIQNKVPLIRLRVTKELVVETVVEIDEDFIEEFKTNIKMIKVNRVIFEFI